MVRPNRDQRLSVARSHRVTRHGTHRERLHDSVSGPSALKPVPDLTIEAGEEPYLSRATLPLSLSPSKQVSWSDADVRFLGPTSAAVTDAHELGFWRSYLRNSFIVLAVQAVGVLGYLLLSPHGPHRGTLETIATIVA